MPSWALRVIAVVVTGLTMVGSTSYALAHPKNPNAPLRPPVVATTDPVPDLEADPTDAPMPFRTLAPTEPPTPSPAPTATPTARASAAARLTAAPTIASTPKVTASPRATATLRATPVPQITLSAGVRATQLPKITITHAS
ncbi:MAG TPA: hypothetical protein VM052_01750 [Candidatus Limnocylindrales bacterium]|nr:hypothetical protein [Candidatus Limnocylindrales bacterium]